MIQSVLIAIDDSERAPDVLRAGIELAAACGARVHVLRVITVPPEFPAAGAGTPPDRLEEVLRQRARDEVAALAARMTTAGVVSGILVRPGEPWPTIVGVADEIEADLIVLGSHGYRGWDRIFGTTTLDVVKHATRSVLVVRSAPPV